MPCNCDHMEPSRKEKMLQHAAKLGVYIHQKLGMDVPYWLEKQSTNIYADDEASETELCAFLRGMSDADRDQLLYGNAKDPMARQLANWWEVHQEADRQREEKEKADAATEALKASATAKLTPEELDALKGK